LTASIMAVVALAHVPAATAMPIPIWVVIRDHANVPVRSLGRAIQIVSDAYRPHVIAQLIAGTLRSTHVDARPTIVYGDGLVAQRL
jgi:hypothetical protein